MIPGSARTARPPLRHRPLRLALASASALAVLTAGACSSPGTDDGGDAAAGAEREPAAQVDPGPAPEVHLVEAGREPTRTLALAAGATPSRTVVTIESGSRTVVAGGRPQDRSTPSQDLTVRGTSDPDVDGAVRSAVTVDSFTSTDERRSAQYSTATGFGLTWLRAADGTVRGETLEAPTGATDAARAGVETAADEVTSGAVVFPHEAVGVGARWEVTRHVDDGVAPTRVTTYRLTALDGDVVTLAVSVRAPGASSTLEAPTDGGDPVRLDVERYEAGGDGELTVDLRAPLPVRGTVRQTTKAVYADPRTGAKTTFDEHRTLGFRPA